MDAEVLPLLPFFLSGFPVISFIYRTFYAALTFFPYFRFYSYANKTRQNKNICKKLKFFEVIDFKIPIM